MVGKKSTTPITPKTLKTISNDASNNQSIIETIQKSLFDITNEIAKVQPRYAQSVSNFQAEYLEATKMVIQTFTNFQSTLIKFNWINFDNRSTLYTDQIKNQVTMLTENIIKTFDIWNQITIDSIDIAKENVKLYTEAMTSMDIRNRDLISSWNSFLIPSYCK
uniref:Uncharacterized protein n=1 Tax=uncultured crenarchaeote TaxID=29281 RepID=Q701Y8_9CREN|nr:hypothetical protein [uncultured crenarchaeote]